MARGVQLFRLPDEINDAVYTSGKYPLLIDPTGQACQFLKYRARVLSAFKRGDLEKETMRKALTQALHSGVWLVLDFDKLDIDLASLFDKDHFPEAVLRPLELFLEETYLPLLRASDEFAARVVYEHVALEAEGAFQDRTKAHAPERVADVNKKFEPKDGFRFILVVKKEEPPAELLDKFVSLKVECSEEQVKTNAGVWAGGERPKKDKSSEQTKLDTDLLEFAFDGETDEVTTLLQKGADPLARDGRGHMPLSEAAVQGHLETVRALLDWKAPIGSDPNAYGSDGRTALHRAAFQGHAGTVQLLLERGSDPRLKDRQGELPFDMASNDESRAALTAWDVNKTDQLRDNRIKAIDIDDEKHVQNDEERRALEKRKRMTKLAEHAAKGEKDELELALADLEPRQLPMYRDDTGNTVLHIAASQGQSEVVNMLIEEYKMDVNLQDSKGWTPIAVAGFYGHKRTCLGLLERKADPTLPNAYRKDAYDVAKDDEIKDTLKSFGLGPLDAAAAAPAEPVARAKADPKSKAKAKAKGGAGARTASTGAKAKAKPRAKSKQR